MEIPTLIDLVKVDVARSETFHAQTVVRQVDWTILEGDFWVVGGLPGTGKSDLLATAAGLQKPNAGTHLLFGREVGSMDEKELVRERLRVGFVFTSGRLFSQTSIAENVALPICYHENCTYQEAEEKVMEALKLTGLEEIAKKRPRDVTRNMHQRIGLARALALGPEVLMIDNPLLGVDPSLGRWWIDFLCQVSTGHESLRGKKLTVAVATDDLRPWKEVGRKFALIKNREWVVVGGREKMQNFSDPILRGLMS